MQSFSSGLAIEHISFSPVHPRGTLTSTDLLRSPQHIEVGGFLMRNEPEVACGHLIPHCSYSIGMLQDSNNHFFCNIAQNSIFSHHIPVALHYLEMDMQSTSSFPGSDFRRKRHVISFLCSESTYYPFCNHQIVGSQLCLRPEEIQSHSAHISFHQW